MASSGVFDPSRGWWEQIDKSVVLGLLEEWLPGQLGVLGFDALWTPKRLIERLGEGLVDRQAVVEVLARYPYLRRPPTPEWETFPDFPAEGSSHDLLVARLNGQIDKSFQLEVLDLEEALLKDESEGS